jgi:CheY-like chemotaxis protein
MNILIVDDNEDMRELLKILLAGLVDNIYECTDGAEALEAYRTFQPDCVLMDIEMRKVDGITATRQIKAAFPQARIIVMTSYEDPDLREAALKAGAARYVLKEEMFTMQRILNPRGNGSATF